MHNFRELNIWKKGIELATDVLKESDNIHKDHKLGITSQIMRSEVSIPSNIAEGSAKTTDKEFARFLDLAQGSSYELGTQLILAKETGLLQIEKLENILNKLNELQKMIRGFKRAIV